MSNHPDRRWMYKRNDSRGYLSEEYCHNVDSFLNFAFSSVVRGCVERKTVGQEVVLRIKCPCVKCKNIHYTTKDDVKLHLIKHGFMRDYTTWWAHGERNVPSQHVGQCTNVMEDDSFDGCAQMIMDNFPPTMPMPSNLEEQVPNSSAKEFYDMLRDADEPLWDGCQKYSKLQAATRLLNWKSECNVPESTFNLLLPIIKDMLPDGNQLVSNFYETKKMLKNLGFPKEKIDACKNHCMLFYKSDSNLTNCRVCGEYRYKNGGQTKIPNL